MSDIKTASHYEELAQKIYYLVKEMYFSGDLTLINVTIY